MLSKYEKELLVTIWEKVAEDAEEIGAESLLRMFSCFPKTKTYFAHLDISPQSEHLCSQGKRIIMAIVEGSKNISALTTTMAPLSALHAYQLKIHPTNFKHLGKCTLTSLMPQTSGIGSGLQHPYIVISDYGELLLCHCILVTLACRMADEFTPEAHAALDKFLSALAAVLSEKYR